MSLINRISNAKYNPYVISTGVTLSYIALYTAYDKTSKSLSLELLKEYVFIRRGWDWSLKETNKVISLSGLTTLLISFLPEYKEGKKELFVISSTLLWLHGSYSFYRFYDLSIAKVMSKRVIKRVSVLLGMISQLVLGIGLVGKINPKVFAVAATTLSMSHFWTMEVDLKYRLQVRPYGYLPFPLSMAAIWKAFF